MQLSVISDQIWVSTQPVDFRRSIDGLCAIISETFSHDPMKGIYLFFNRGKDKVKLLSWHRNGFVLVYKRLERGRFHVRYDNEKDLVTVNVKQLGWILAGLDWVEMSQWDELEFDEFI